MLSKQHRKELSKLAIWWLPVPIEYHRSHRVRARRLARWRRQHARGVTRWRGKHDLHMFYVRMRAELEELHKLYPAPAIDWVER